MPHLHVALDGSFMELTSTWTSRLRADATWARDGCYPFEWWGFRFTVGTGQGPRLPRATPVICCAHSVPSSVAQHARRGPRARRGGGSRCISFPSFWGSARIKNNVSFCPQSGGSAAPLPASGTSCKLLAKLSRLRNRVTTLHSTVQVHGPA